MHQLDFLLSNRQWWRRWRGGHWERWEIGDYWTLWLPNPHGEIPGWARRRLCCEDW